jgi:hypothetical protein
LQDKVVYICEMRWYHSKQEIRESAIGSVSMPIDPTIVVAITKAAGGLLQKLLELAGRPSPDAGQVLLRVYEKVADAVSPNCLRVLIVLQSSGAFQTPEQILEPAQKAALRQEPTGRPFENDIAYRLRYLGLLGLVRVGSVDFALTDFGAAFIEHARRDKHRYGNVFKDFGAR